MSTVDDHPHDIIHDDEAPISREPESVQDPPPPYPSSRRSRRSRRSGGYTSHQQRSSTEDNEAVPFLVPPSPHLASSRPSGSEQRRTRVRSDSHGSMWSTISGSPSLAQTVFNFFEDVDVESEAEGCREPQNGPGAGPIHLEHDAVEGSNSATVDWIAKIRRYCRPLRKKVYYMSLIHLMLVNFPIALLAWVSLFVLTLLGTTLLMLLPLGLLLCFFDLLWARLLTRFELHLQMTFHFPSASIRRKPPIFTRPRPQRVDEESPLIQPDPATTLNNPLAVRHVLLDETSFYKNTYAMFTDPTSYHALFYFLVIKPPITLLFTVFMLGVILPLLMGIVTAPAALRLCRRMGVWQAAVAVEGLAGEA